MLCCSLYSHWKTLPRALFERLEKLDKLLIRDSAFKKDWNVFQLLRFFEIHSIRSFKLQLYGAFAKSQAISYLNSVENWANSGLTVFVQLL